MATSDDPSKLTTQCNFSANFGGTTFTFTSNPITFFSAGNTQVIKRIGQVEADNCQEISYPKNHPISITYSIKLDNCILADQNIFILDDLLFDSEWYGQYFNLLSVNIWINGIQKNYLYNFNKPIIIPTNELQCDDSGECNIIIESIVIYWQSSKQPITFFSPIICKLIRSEVPTDLPCEVIGVGEIIDSSLLKRKYLRSIELLNNSYELRTYQIIYENVCSAYPVFFFDGCIAEKIADEEWAVSLQSDNRMQIYINCIRCCCSFPICPNETYSFSYQTVKIPGCSICLPGTLLNY